MLAQGLRKYLSILYAFFKTSLITDLEYRVNLVTRFLSDILWYTGQLMTFEVLFLHMNTIGGWGAPQMRVFLGLLFLVDALYMMFWHEGLSSMTEAVRKGDLDFLLIRPANSQFIITSQKIATAYIGNLTLSIVWFFWACSQIEDFNWLKLIWLLIMIPAALTVIYTVRFFLSASSILFTRADFLQFMWYTIFRLGHRPDSIYSGLMRYVILFIIPVGMVASVPARVLLEPIDWRLILWALAIIPTGALLTHKYWQFCLSRYTSASS
jgi:ABC-2 type transport system permease protein